MNAPLPKLYTDDEAAVFLRVKPCTVRNLRIRGQLGYVMIGRRVFYTHEHLVEYLERQKVSASGTMVCPLDTPRRVPGRPLSDHAAQSVRDAVSDYAERTFTPASRRRTSANRRDAA